eukprot:1153542-Amphidinium_carterae.1
MPQIVDAKIARIDHASQFRNLETVLEWLLTDHTCLWWGLIHTASSTPCFKHEQTTHDGITTEAATCQTLCVCFLFARFTVWLFCHSFGFRTTKARFSVVSPRHSLMVDSIIWGRKLTSIYGGITLTVAPAE